MAVDVGDQAPDFTLKDQQNQDVTLSDFRGRKNVVLLFHPLAFSSICQDELCAVRDELPSFQNDDVQVLAVSVDSVHSHRVWAEQEGYDFPLLADFWPHGAVAQEYGCFNEERGIAIRGTYIIGKDGIVRHRVLNQTPDIRDQGEYLKALAEL